MVGIIMKILHADQETQSRYVTCLGAKMGTFAFQVPKQQRLILPDLTHSRVALSQAARTPLLMFLINLHFHSPTRIRVGRKSTGLTNLKTILNNLKQTLSFTFLPSSLCHIFKL